MDIQMVRECGLAVMGEWWPDLNNLWLEATSRPRPDWELVEVAARSVGSDVDCTAVCAAVGLLQQAIVIVDDILDNDSRGIQWKVGPGMAANIALAMAAASTAVITHSKQPAEVVTAVCRILARCNADTAVGQWLDAMRPLDDEATYWRVVRAKSTPFYGMVLAAGGVLGGADTAVAQSLYDLGVSLGEAVQVRDDMTDAFAVPASPDWYGRQNLLILYAMLTERDAFNPLYQQVHQPKILEEAQQFLADCGAVDYVRQWLERRQGELLDQLAAIPLVDPERLKEVVIAVTKNPLGD